MNTCLVINDACKCCRIIYQLILSLLKKNVKIIGQKVKRKWLILCSIDILLVRSSEVLPENLSSRRLGDLRDKLNSTSQVLVWGEGGSNMTLDFFLCHPFPTLDHIGPWHLSCPCICNSNNSNISHSLQSSDMVLQFSRGNLQPLHLDQLFLPVHKKHHSILIIE